MKGSARRRCVKSPGNAGNTFESRRTVPPVVACPEVSEVAQIRQYNCCQLLCGTCHRCYVHFFRSLFRVAPFVCFSCPESAVTTYIYSCDCAAPPKLCGIQHFLKQAASCHVCSEVRCSFVLEGCSYSASSSNFDYTRLCLERSCKASSQPCILGTAPWGQKQHLKRLRPRSTWT